MGFTTVSLADLLWLFLVGLVPLSLFALLSFEGETQIWLGDLRLALCFGFFDVMICQLHATTGVHVAVFLPIASSHVRTEP